MEVLRKKTFEGINIRILTPR